MPGHDFPVREWNDAADMTVMPGFKPVTALRLEDMVGIIGGAAAAGPIFRQIDRGLGPQTFLAALGSPGVTIAGGLSFIVGYNLAWRSAALGFTALDKTVRAADRYSLNR